MSLKFAFLFALVFVAYVSAQEGYGQSAQPPPPSAPAPGPLPGFQLPIPEVQSMFNNFLQTIGLQTLVQQLSNNVVPMVGNGFSAITGGLPALMGNNGASPSPSPNANANPNYKK